MYLIYSITFSYLPIRIDLSYAHKYSNRKAQRATTQTQSLARIKRILWCEARRRSWEHCRPKANLKRHINSILWHKTRILITNFARLTITRKILLPFFFSCSSFFRQQGDPNRINGHHRMAKSISSLFSFRFVSITITSLAGRFYYRLLLFLGTTHLGSKNKGREADTIEKQKPAAKK